MKKAITLFTFSALALALAGLSSSEAASCRIVLNSSDDGLNTATCEENNSFDVRNESRATVNIDGSYNLNTGSTLISVGDDATDVSLDNGDVESNLVELYDINSSIVNYEPLGTGSAEGEIGGNSGDDAMNVLTVSETNTESVENDTGTDYDEDFEQNVNTGGDTVVVGEDLERFTGKTGKISHSSSRSVSIGWFQVQRDADFNVVGP